MISFLIRVNNARPLNLSETAKIFDKTAGHSRAVSVKVNEVELCCDLFFRQTEENQPFLQVVPIYEIFLKKLTYSPEQVPS